MQKSKCFEEIPSYKIARMSRNLMRGGLRRR